MQTREERNKIKANNRAAILHSRYVSWKSSILELWLRAKKEKMTFVAILNYRNEWITGTEAYKMLPMWIKYQLTGVWDVLMDLAYRQELVHCYPHPQTGVITPGKVICDQGFAQELSDKGLDKQGNHYWKNEDGTFTHPF